MYENTKDAWKILNKISDCKNDSDYEDLLRELADKLFDKEYLAEQNKEEKVGTIYECDGKFKFVEIPDDDYEDDYDDWDDEEEDEEEE